MSPSTRRPSGVYVLKVLLAEDMRASFTQAAKAAGLPVSTWLRHLGVQHLIRDGGTVCRLRANTDEDPVEDNLEEIFRLCRTIALRIETLRGEERRALITRYDTAFSSFLVTLKMIVDDVLPLLPDREGP